jgi:RHS repeat-associated protein
VENSPDGNILSRYIYANGKHVAEINGADTSWYHGDALGSTRVMTSELGDNVWYSKYQAFGEMVGDGGNEHSFTGKEWDTEIGLNYFCQRYYDADIGRFMEMDPILNPSVSSYAYCNNNPLIHTDPTGNNISFMFDIVVELLSDPFNPMMEIVGSILGNGSGPGVEDPYAADATATNLPIISPIWLLPPPVWPFPNNNPWIR